MGQTPLHVYPAGYAVAGNQPSGCLQLFNLKLVKDYVPDLLDIYDLEGCAAFLQSSVVGRLASALRIEQGLVQYYRAVLQDGLHLCLEDLVKGMVVEHKFSLLSVY